MAQEQISDAGTPAISLIKAIKYDEQASNKFDK
jgi:hypothetical protein